MSARENGWWFPQFTALSQLCISNNSNTNNNSDNMCNNHSYSNSTSTSNNSTRPADSARISAALGKGVFHRPQNALPEDAVTAKDKPHGFSRLGLHRVL